MLNKHPSKNKFVYLRYFIMVPQIREGGKKNPSQNIFDCANSGRTASLSTIFKGEVCQKPFQLLRNELSSK